MTVVIRDFTETEDEFELFEAGEAEAFDGSFPGRSIDSNFLEGRVAWLVTGKVYVLLDNEHPIGYVVLHHDRSIGYVSSIYVTPEHRGRSHVRSLLDHVAAKLTDIGVNTLQLDVSVVNEEAIRAYEKYGFRIKRHQMELELDA